MRHVTSTVSDVRMGRLQAGAPVLTSNVSSLPEVAGDAAVLVDPYDSGAISAGLARLLSDPAERERLRGAGRERARAFSWDRFAAETLAALAAIRGRRGRSATAR